MSIAFAVLLGAVKGPPLMLECFNPKTAYQRGSASKFTFKHPGYSVRSGVSDVRTVLLPCGQCIACRLQKSAEWAMRATHEAKLHERNCWVTLTYRPGEEPQSREAWRRDAALFFKRLRKHFKPVKVRYFGCGEHGENSTKRPHFHFCLFGVDFPDMVARARTKSGKLSYSSEVLSSLWTQGWATCAELTEQDAAYTARYALKKAAGLRSAQERSGLTNQYVHSSGEISCRPETLLFCSLRPGIGAGWFDRYKGDVISGLSKSTGYRKGTRVRTPAYYWKLLKQSDPEIHAAKKAEHAAHIEIDWGEVNPDRLEARETVLRAKIRNLKREAF